MTDSKQKSKPEEIFMWLAPTDNELSGEFYLKDVEDARTLRHHDTCRWIEPRPEYQDWMTCDNDSQSSLLWIHAIPGAGETVLASFPVDKAGEWDSSSVSYFFFKDVDSEKEHGDRSSTGATVSAFGKWQPFAHIKFTTTFNGTRRN